jgi:hypothetical protein
VPTSTSTLYVTATPNTPGATATYRIASFQVNGSGIPAGGTFEVEGQTDAPGTIFPTTTTDYTLIDLTHPADGGVPTAITYDAFTSNVIITVPNAIPAGDILALTIAGVTNPTSGGVFSLQLGGPVQGLSVLTSAPNAALSGPNFGITKSNDGAVFNWAGGKAFPITSQAEYAMVIGNYPKPLRPTVATGVTVTPAQITGTARPGTLIKVVGKSTIYVVGTTGNVYSFNSPSNFINDGYNPGAVVPVESLAGLIPASGAAPTAAQTLADDALLAGSKGGVYLMEGGEAFPLTSPTQLATVEGWDKAKVISGTVTANNTNAAPASGILFQAAGTKGVYVSYDSVLYTIVSPTILTADGYTFGMVKVVPSVSQLPIAVVTK